MRSALRPFPRSWLRREVLPSIAIGPGTPSRNSATQAWKQTRNLSGSITANTSHMVSWLGMPSAYG
jgi:hypothetical protein